MHMTLASGEVEPARVGGPARGSIDQAGRLTRLSDLSTQLPPN